MAADASLATGASLQLLVLVYSCWCKSIAAGASL